MSTVKTLMHSVQKAPWKGENGNSKDIIPERPDEENSNKAPCKTTRENCPKNRNNEGNNFSGHVPIPSFYAVWSLQDFVCTLPQDQIVCQ